MRIASIASRVARQLTSTPAVRLSHPALPPRQHCGGRTSMTHLGGGLRGNGGTADKDEVMRGLPEVRHSLIEVGSNTSRHRRHCRITTAFLSTSSSPITLPHDTYDTTTWLNLPNDHFFSQVHLLGKTILVLVASTGIHNPSPSLSTQTKTRVSTRTLPLHRRSRYPLQRRSSRGGVRRLSVIGWRTKWARSVPHSPPSSPSTR